MFIEELWNKDKKIIKREIKKIFNIDREREYKLEFEKFEEGVLKFKKIGPYSTFIEVRDFDIRTEYNISNYQNSPVTIEWMAFMINNFGDKYVSEFKKYRKAQLKDYSENFKSETNNIIVNVYDEIERHHLHR